MRDVIRSGRVWGLVLLTLALAVPAAAQFTESTDVVVVEVPVQVLGKDGEPVRGLTAADFEVSEGRKKLPITGFEVLDLEIAGEKPADMPTAARRHFLMLFDLSFSEPKSIIKARQAAADVVDSLHATDLVAVATYSQSNGPQLVLGFTPDRRQAKLALETLGLPQLVDRTPDPLRMVMMEMEDQVRSQPVGAGSSEKPGGDREAMVLEQLQSLTRESDKANQIVLENKVRALTRSFADLARLMNGVQGRKHVVYLSEGYDSSVLSGAVSDDEQAAMSESSVSGEIWNVDSDKRYGSTSAGNDVEQMLEAFRRSDCVIQAVDIGGLRDSGERNARGKDALIQMARGTGGDIYENFNDLSTAMDKMLKRTSVTYVLAVQPENLKHDGAYHKLKVELKGGKGGRIVHRPGYLAPKAGAQQNPLERTLAMGSQLMGGEDSGSINASVMAAAFRAASGDRAYVPVVIEVDGPGLLAGKQGATLPAEIYVYAMDQDGNVQDFLAQSPGPGPRQGRAAAQAERHEVLRPPGPAAGPVRGAGAGAQRRHRRARPPRHPAQGAGLHRGGRPGAAAPLLPRAARQVADDPGAAAGRADERAVPVHAQGPALHPVVHAGPRRRPGGPGRPGGLQPGQRRRQGARPGLRRGRQGGGARGDQGAGAGERRRGRSGPAGGRLPAARPAGPGSTRCASRCRTGGERTSVAPPSWSGRPAAALFREGHQTEG